MAGCRYHRYEKWLQRPGCESTDGAERRSHVRPCFIFRGRSGSQVKLLWSTGDGLCLLTKRLERGRFAWPSARDGKVFLTQAQLAMLLEGIDWRQPKRLLTSLTML